MSSDVELLSRWGEGDTEAGEALFERYYESVSRFFESKLDAGVDDIVQQTFAALVTGRDRIRKTGSFRSYLFGIAHNLLREHVRGLVRDRKRFDPDTASAVDISPGPESVREAQQWRRLVLRALRMIPLPAQIVLELYYWEGFTTAEIADALEIPHPTVRSRLRRARESLVEALRTVEASGAALQSTLDDLERWAVEARGDALTPRGESTSAN